MTGNPAGRDYYSFDHGPIHFVQFSTEVNFEPGSDQYAFVTADLAAVDRSKTPWIIAGFHRPYITPTVRLALDFTLVSNSRSHGVRAAHRRCCCPTWLAVPAAIIWLK